MKTSENEIIAEIRQKLLDNRSADLKTGLNAEKYYFLNDFRDDISHLNLEGLETLKCDGPFTYEANRDHSLILNDVIEVLRSRKGRSKTNWALGIAIGSAIVSIVALFK